MLMIISSDLMEGPNDDEIAKENAIGVSVDPKETLFHKYVTPMHLKHNSFDFLFIVIHIRIIDIIIKQCQNIFSNDKFFGKF